MNCASKAAERERGQGPRKDNRDDEDDEEDQIGKQHGNKDALGGYGYQGSKLLGRGGLSSKMMAEQLHQIQNDSN